MGSEHGFYRLYLGDKFVAAMSRGASYAPPPAGSAYHLNFKEDTAWQGATLLGGVSELLSGTLRLSGAGLEVQNGDDYEFASGIATLVGTNTGSAVVGVLSTTSVNDGRIIGSSNANNQDILQLDGTATNIGAWNGSNYISAAFGSGDDSGPFKAAIGFDPAARSLVANDGTVATDTNVALTQAVGSLYFGGDGGNNVQAVGIYEFVTFYSTKLSDAALKALTA